MTEMEDLRLAGTTKNSVYGSVNNGKNASGLINGI
jgi:hypothetical protein